MTPWRCFSINALIISSISSSYFCAFWWRDFNHKLKQKISISSTNSIKKKAPWSPEGAFAWFQAQIVSILFLWKVRLNNKKNDVLTLTKKLHPESAFEWFQAQTVSILFLRKVFLNNKKKHSECTFECTFEWFQAQTVSMLFLRKVLLSNNKKWHPEGVFQ